jgi:release factor glutamine methyltransferase
MKMTVAEKLTVPSRLPPPRADLIAELRDLSVCDQEIDEIVQLAGGDEGRLRRLVTRKRFGEPNAYLRGTATLMGRSFKIDRRCYIPDSYATELVARVLKDAPPGGSVLEVGTGCGWISITLKCQRRDLSLAAVDIDPNALTLAAENARAHDASIRFQESYYVDDVTAAVPDLVIANIPYGGDADYSQRELEERPQMPPIALFDPVGPAVPLVEFVASVRRRGWKSRIYLETGYLEMSALAPVCAGFADVEHVRNGEFGYLVLTP